MSDSVTNLVGNAEPRTVAASGFQNAEVPLSDLFADVLNKNTFVERLLSQSEFGLTRAAERDYEVRQEDYNAEQDRADSEPSDDTSAEVRDSDDRSQDGDDRSQDGEEADFGKQTVDQQQDDGASVSQQISAVVLEGSLPAFNATANNPQKPGLSVQPNSASDVELQLKDAGPAPGQPRVIITRGEIQAAAHDTANSAHARGQDTTARATSALGNNLSGANAQQPDAAVMKSGPDLDAASLKTGPNPDAAVAKPGLNVDAAAVDKPQTNGGPALPQTQTAIEADAERLGTSLEKHTLLIRAGAKRAAELHYMKIRLSAHRDAIKKAIAQSTAGSNGAQPQNATSSAGKPTIEVTTSATPPAAAALDGPPARPAALFNSPTPGSLPGQSGVNGSPSLATGETAGNGVEQSTAAADRQVMTSNSTRGLGLRPTPAQPTYQPAEQVKVHIQQLVKSGTDRIQVRLSPASLGRVEVALEMTPDKVVQAIVYAEKPETLDMLERDARVLQQALEEAGFKLNSDGLLFKHGQSGNADAELADGPGSPGTDDPADADGSDADESAASDQPHRRQHDGVLDLEI